MRYAILTIAALATPAQADLVLNFVEGAPKDRFDLINEGDCTVPAAILKIELEGSAGRLIFDLAGSGAGVEVFQPFEVTEGASSIRDMPMVQDGDRQLALPLHDLPPGTRVSFTLDLDDTAGSRAITVSGSEMAGAQMVYSEQTAVFGTDSSARIATTDCGA